MAIRQRPGTVPASYEDGEECRVNVLVTLTVGRDMQGKKFAIPGLEEYRLAGSEECLLAIGDDRYKHMRHDSIVRIKAEDLEAMRKAVAAEEQSNPH